MCLNAQDSFFHLFKKYWLTSLLQKTKIMASRGKMETVVDFILLGSKITAAMKLKDTCSLEEKLWQTYTA